MLTDDALAVAEPIEMAKKKPISGPRTLFAVKGSQEWFDWLKRFADLEGVSAMTLIDLALKEKAQRAKNPEPMPKRIARSAD